MAQSCCSLTPTIMDRGGFFLWVELLGGLEPADVQIAAIRHGLTMSSGPNFYVSKSRADRSHMQCSLR